MSRFFGSEKLQSYFRSQARRLMLAVALLPVTTMVPTASHAAMGELGTGVPVFGVFSDPVGAQVIIWGIANATRPFAAGCTNLRIVRATVGAESYKLMVATLITARVANRSVRFYSHAERDGGCGADYVEIAD